MNPILHQIFAVRATERANVYQVDVDLTDMVGERYTCEYLSDPDDTFGLAPTIRQWLITNAGNYEIAPYVPPPEPTIEEIRAAMPHITPRQFWIAASSIGVSKQDVLDVVATMTDEAEKIRMQIEILEATVYERTNPYIDDLSGVLGITGEQLDALWMWASAV